MRAIRKSYKKRSVAHAILLSQLLFIQVTHGKQKIASIQGFVSQERDKYEKMVSSMMSHATVWFI